MGKSPFGQNIDFEPYSTTPKERPTNSMEG
jgi:hypothetical protein